MYRFSFQTIIKSLVIFSTSFIITGGVSAQFYSGPDLDFMTMQHNSYLSNMNLIQSNSDYFAEEYRREKNKNGSNNTEGKSISPDSKSFIFTSHKAVSDRLKQSIIDNNKKKFPNSKLGEALNDENNPYPNYVKLLKSSGLDVQSNYADAFTAYLLGMWRIANQMSQNPNAKQVNAVRRQVVSTIHVDGWNNQQKQEAAEYLMYKLIFANEPYEGSLMDKNISQINADSDAVQNSFLKENKLDLRNMIITENGLVRKVQE